MTEIHGFVAAGFEPVRDAFAANFESGLECGASVAVTKDGESVVDLWAGDAGPEGQPWQDTVGEWSGCTIEAGQGVVFKFSTQSQ